MKHTPWHIAEYGTNEDGSPKFYAIKFGEKTIANLGLNGEYAALIAAAPETAVERDRLKEINAELLGALKELFKHCAMIHNTWGDGSNQKEADAAISNAKAIIAKAEGK